jgi:Na+-transporting NADH:ubiquinone oxidoreductase subunit NqrF
MDFSKYSEEEIQDMIDDIEQDSHHGDHLSHEEDMMDQHGHDADNAEREFMAGEKEHELMLSPEEGEDLPSHSGMGRRLSESLKLVIREAIEENTVDECGISEEEALEEPELIETCRLSCQIRVTSDLTVEVIHTVTNSGKDGAGQTVTE